ncbi:MAG: amino acid ABC transporter substrate-binding protein [Rhizobiales bacterium]|nr:amino acid ABC transporter substrate-binding protein [Hyphomicrobiales bacterium]
MKLKLLSGAIGIITMLVAPSSFAATLDDVEAKGFVRCGVNKGLEGFSFQDAKGAWSGIDVDLCRGIAAAIFGDAGKVKYTPLSAKKRFNALLSGEIDVLVRNTTWTMGRDTKMGLNFAGINYYDGQGFMVRKNMDIKSALELSSISVCSTSGTTSQLNAVDYFKNNKVEYEIISFEKAVEAVAAYDSGRCQVYTADHSGLNAKRLELTTPSDHIVLPEIISKEPLGPAVRQGDDQWFNIVKWTHFAMLNAEELGVSKDNVESLISTENPAIKRLLGVDEKFGVALGLKNDWALNIVKLVGNYADIFNANIGPDTRLGIARGKNALWSDGGLQYAPPIR